MCRAQFGFSTASAAEFSGTLPAPDHAARAADGMTAPIHTRILKILNYRGIPLLGKYWLSFGCHPRKK
jgi:hypothetical protein